MNKETQMWSYLWDLLNKTIVETDNWLMTVSGIFQVVFEFLNLVRENLPIYLVIGYGSETENLWPSVR